MLKPEYRDMFLEKVKNYGSEGWEEVFNRVVSLPCIAMNPLLTVA
jgi:hypothetical protein